ncbi:hypothetical protein D3C71_1490990 [compost metagenome]
MTIANPINIAQCIKIKVRLLVSVELLVNRKPAMVAMENPSGSNNFGPNLSNILPVTGAIAPLITLPGRSRIPAAVADNNKPPFKYNGNKMAEDKMIIIPKKTIIRPIVNIGYLNTRKFSIGVSNLNCLNTNRIKLMTPTIRGR